MNPVSTLPSPRLFPLNALKRTDLLRAFLTGSLLPLGFAPFHLPIIAILGLALFYTQLSKSTPGRSYLIGLFFGLGYFGLGISWVFISIHEYGHLNDLLSALITLCFLLYLSIFPALMARSYCYLIVTARATNPHPQPFSLAREKGARSAWLMRSEPEIHLDLLPSPLSRGEGLGMRGWSHEQLHLNNKYSPLLSVFLFASLWILFEYFRAGFLSGFPWLILGFGQFDTPGKYIIPILGVYGAGFISCTVAAFLAETIQQQGLKRWMMLFGLVLAIFLPLLGKNHSWSEQSDKSLSVGIIQANLSMRDKWDESLFWTLLARYQQDTETLLGTDLIVMPESAIPLPVHYLEDYFTNLHQKAKQLGSAILLGIPQPVSADNEIYYNTMFALGKARGNYQKQHLVPFGEYMPGPFQAITRFLSIPDANLKQGQSHQSLIRVKGQPIASLICYELAYGELLRQQLPEAKWIVSISDDGWFGHSLALYQQQQMAQVRSLQTARYQVVSNNDGLSSIIDTKGNISAVLPAFSAGILKGVIFPATGSTPWIRWGDWPILLGCFVFVLISLIFRRFNRKLNQ